MFLRKAVAGLVSLYALWCVGGVVLGSGQGSTALDFDEGLKKTLTNGFNVSVRDSLANKCYVEDGAPREVVYYKRPRGYAVDGGLLAATFFQKGWSERHVVGTVPDIHESGVACDKLKDGAGLTAVAAVQKFDEVARKVIEGADAKKVREATGARQGYFAIEQPVAPKQG